MILNICKIMTVFLIFLGQNLEKIISVLIRSDCVGAISALLKGSFRSPALQTVVFLHNSLFMDLGAMPPLYLHAPGSVLKAEGVDGLSQETAGRPSR